MATVKATVVIGDQASAEFDALKRSYNSLLLALKGISDEVVATTLTPIQGFQAISNMLATGVDGSGTPAPHVGTNRRVTGVKSSPAIPLRASEKANSVIKLVDMVDSDKY